MELASHRGMGQRSQFLRRGTTIPTTRRSVGKKIVASAHINSGHNAVNQIAGTLTEKMFERMDAASSADRGTSGGAGGATTLQSFQRLDAAWSDLRNRTVYGLPPKTVKVTKDALPAVPGLDVIVGGGTLGVFLAMALQARGLRTAIIERGALRGRDQDWNISREELYALVDAGVVSKEQADDSITIEFNPIKAGFHGSEDIVTRDVLNLGVSPKTLIDHVRENYENAGGLVVESAALEKIWVHPNGVQARVRNQSQEKTLALASKLFIDCMGNQSPIVRQVRHGQKPDGVCLVVGSCGRGFTDNSHGDIIRTISPSESPDTEHTGCRNTQMFWEAFPAGSGPTDRTTYMFSYMDAEADRPSFLDMMEHYWREMPKYQGISTLDDIQVQRILFGLFPTYRDSPLQPSFDRILAIGDASGIQSPLSFGGFAALTRHLGRLTNAIEDAIRYECLDKWSLRYINAYNPSLSVAWMFQKAMSIPAGASRYNVNFINRLLGMNFKIMDQKGDAILKPFLQDVIQARPLTETLLSQMKSSPLFVPVIMQTVGLPALTDFITHYIALVLYTWLSSTATKKNLKEAIEARVTDPKQRFIALRALERWTFGSGLDAHS
ncbi:hypothetical protein PSENEW3_00002866 [Picochlorum sp. SENEW3]|nr:hypothetical protein PSENEW3_00002866 [Picochlorum sp. SENEW3]